MWHPWRTELSSSWGHPQLFSWHLLPLSVPFPPVKCDKQKQVTLGETFSFPSSQGHHRECDQMSTLMRTGNSCFPPLLWNSDHFFFGLRQAEPVWFSSVVRDLQFDAETGREMQTYRKPCLTLLLLLSPDSLLLRSFSSALLLQEAVAEA